MATEDIQWVYGYVSVLDGACVRCNSRAEMAFSPELADQINPPFDDCTNPSCRCMTVLVAEEEIGERKVGLIRELLASRRGRVPMAEICKITDGGEG